MRGAREAAFKAVKLAQERMKKYADAKRRDVSFQVGDFVLLSTANIRLPPTPGSESYKLNEKYLGPFKVLKRIGELSYELELPSLMRVHPVFHVSKLKRFKRSPERFGVRTVGPFSGDVAADPEEEWVITEVVDQGISEARFCFGWSRNTRSARDLLLLSRSFL